MWIAGGILTRPLDEIHRGTHMSKEGWPGVTVLIPAYNEGPTIETSVRAALASNYPELEVIVLDDGSTDDTVLRAREAIGGDRRARVIEDAINVGKADRLNMGFAVAQHPLVVVTDADAHMHPEALRHMAAVMEGSAMLAAVASSVHVTNRTTILAEMQVLEAVAVIALIRRTQSLTGRVGTVAGVLGMFRKGRVLAVGGYDGSMATEDIDLTWRLLMAGWHTAYVPQAMIGMQVPQRLKPLWRQRVRWARGQGEVIHRHILTVLRWRHRRMWLLAFESLASLAWVICWPIAIALSIANVLFRHDLGFFAFGMAWGAAISIVATIQVLVALLLRVRYSPFDYRALLIGALYPIGYWSISAAAALHSEIRAVVTGPRSQRVTWNIEREATSGPEAPGKPVRGDRPQQAGDSAGPAS